MWTDDPVDDFMRHDAEMSRKESLLPTCAACGKPIHDDYCIDLSECLAEGWTLCEDCLNRYFRGGINLDEDLKQVMRDAIYDNFRRRLNI